MKKGVLIYVLVLFILLLQACGNAEKKDQEQGNQQQAEETNKGVSGLNEVENDEKPNDDVNENKENSKNNVENEEQREATGIQSDTLVSDALPLPTNFEEIIAYPVGPLSGNGNHAQLDHKNDLTDEELVSEIMRILPPFTKEQLQEDGFLEQWFSALYYLIAEDYKHPQFIYDELVLESFGKQMLNGKPIEFKNQLNVLLILDASGSMETMLNGEKMIDIAKREMNQLIDELPEHVNIGLRIYGGNKDGNAEKCTDTKLYHSLSATNKAEMKETINSITPSGWTPIAESLKQAADDFSEYPSETNTNIIYLITDGVETCDGNPEGEIQALQQSSVQPMINVIGFNIDLKGQEELKKLAESGGGQYIHAANKQGFIDSMNSIQRLLQAWEKQKFAAIDDAITARGKLDTAIYELAKEWEEQLTDEYKVMMLMMDEFNFSRDYFEDKQVFFDVHNQLLDMISDKNTLYRQIFEEESKKIKENIDKAFEDILSELN